MVAGSKGGFKGGNVTYCCGSDLSTFSESQGISKTHNHGNSGSRIGGFGAP